MRQVEPKIIDDIFTALDWQIGVLGESNDVYAEFSVHP